MGICSSKCSHYPPDEPCCSQKLIPKLRSTEAAVAAAAAAAAELLLFEVAEDNNNNVIRRNAKSEEEVFGYSIISQDNRGIVKPAMAKSDIIVAPERLVSIGGKMHLPLVLTNDKIATYTPPASTDLNVYIVTWNMNGKPLVRSIAKLLDGDGERHDLYVIGLQEAHTSIVESVIIDALGEKYSFIAAANMVSLQLFVVAKKTVLPFLSRPMVDKVSMGGLGGLTGRQKGAVAITLRYKNASLLFITSHLAPHEGNIGERNSQYHRISQAVFAKQVQVVPPVAGTVCSSCSSYRNGLIADESGLCAEHAFRSSSKFLDQADVVVWLGDLNYRVEMSRSSVIFLIRHKLEEVLWSKDQLTRVLKKGQAFMGFQEGSLSFKPTYKYDVGTDNYDTSAKERVPSWTDRILYKVGDFSKLKVKLKSYSSINSIKTSDHRPVKALLTLSDNKQKVKCRK